jgi:hypothetical protein
MARFRLTKAFVVGGIKFCAGDIVSDAAPTTVGDKHWPGLTAGTMGSGMVPIDGPATTMKNASAFASEQVPATITGVDSIGR